MKRQVFSLPLLLFLLTCGFCAVAEESAGVVESRSLMQCWPAERWWCMTSTMTQTADADPARLCWKVLVDYKGGEERHPIGWPFADAYLMHLPKELQDWRQFDELVLHAKATFSRATEEPLPVYVEFCAKGGRRLHRAGIPDPVPGQEREMRIDLSQIPELGKMAMLRIYVYEGQYRHGDLLELELWDIQLKRSKSVRVEEFFLASPSVFADSPRLTGEARLVGPDPLIGKGISAAIFRHGESKPVAEKLLPLHRGRQSWELDLASLHLPPGKYEIVLFADSPASRIVREFTIVSSPWKEASK